MTAPEGSNRGTRAEDRGDSFAAHQADRSATEDEEEAAERALESETPEDQARVREHYEEMAERGVKQKGEGRLD